MLFRRTLLLRSAYDELTVVGSRWTRILAKPRQSVSSAAQTNQPVPFITLIPTLHVASIDYYDRVLEYVQKAVHNKKQHVVVLLEGICDSEEAEKQQMREYADIMGDESLRQAIRLKAAENSLYTPEVMREICQELAVNYDVLQSLQDKVRLQECYLKPKMAASCGLHLRNNADLDMKEVQMLLEEEQQRLQSLGESLPASVSVRDIGAFPVIRKQRERKVARVARRQCEKWLLNDLKGEVIVPWGFYHADAIKHYIMEANAAVEGDGATDGATLAASDDGYDGAPPCMFVEADHLVAKVSFGIPREVLDVAPLNPPTSPTPTPAS